MLFGVEVLQRFLVRTVDLYSLAIAQGLKSTKQVFA